MTDDLEKNLNIHIELPAETKVEGGCPYLRKSAHSEGIQFHCSPCKSLINDQYMKIFCNKDFESCEEYQKANKK